MKEIIKKDVIIDLVLPKQKYVSGNIYRPLTYIVYCKSGNETLLLNTMTRQMLALSDDEVLSLKLEKESPILRKLISDYFFVVNHHNDQLLREQLLSFKKKVVNNVIDNYVILPTMQCNARCFYCFEHGTEKHSMSAETALKSAEYIIEKSQGNPVKIKWFGGEPLCNIEAIDIISNFLAENNIQYTSTMITNGYCFDKKIVNKAVSLWKLKSLQITLDGTENTYNHTKNYIGKITESPFYKVLDNIEILIKANIHVIIRLNLDKHNKDELFDLVKLLYARFKEHTNLLTVYSYLLFENRGIVKKSRSEEERQMLTKVQLALEEFIEEKGMSTKSEPAKQMRICKCYADSENSVIILPKGDLGKCDHHSDDEFFGSIYNQEINQSIINSWKEYRSGGILCKTCPVSPDCFKLKKCPDDGHYECDLYLQQRIIDKTKRQMKNAYNKYNSTQQK